MKKRNSQHSFAFVLLAGMLCFLVSGCRDLKKENKPESQSTAYASSSIFLAEPKSVQYPMEEATMQLVASIPAGVVGILWDDVFTKYFYNYQTVAIMLILVGVIFIIIERSNKNKIAKIDSIDDISYGQAFLIGVFQMIAAIFPGTSRSGSTIVGSLMLGISRTAAAEFTFFLAVPAMFGGSAIKILKYSGGFNSAEVALLAIGMIVAFVLSIIAIKFLMSYIKKHDFKVFGWYRIILGIAVIGYFLATILSAV